MGTTPTLPALLDDWSLSPQNSWMNRTSVMFSPDGALLASGGAQPQLRLWNLRRPTDTPLIQDLEVNSALAFSPDSARLAFAAAVAGGGAQLWDLRNPAEPPLTLTGHGLPASHLSFSAARN